MDSLMPSISFDGKWKKKVNFKLKKIWGPNMAQIIPGSLVCELLK